MKKSPSSSSPVSSSSSSSSSCIESSMAIPKHALKPKPQPRPRKSRTKDTNSNSNSVTSRKSRSSIYRGVTRHRWTGRFEAHLWDKAWNAAQNKRGRQIYLGAYDNEEDAARTYDMAALKYWGRDTTLNFPVEMYTNQLEEMGKMTREEYLASLRRQSSGFSRGVSKYRGVARHHHNGRWEARIGRVCGNKYLYLGTFGTQEEAAEAYDKAALEHRGPNAITNFDINRYTHMLKNFAPKQEDMQTIDERRRAPPTNVVPPIVASVDHGKNENQNALNLEPMDDAIDSQAMAAMYPVEAQAMAMMNHGQAEAPKHPWDDICLDVGFNNFSIMDITLGQGSDVFDYKGFEDNIEFIFDGTMNETDMFLQDALSGNSGSNVEAMAPGAMLSSPYLTSSVSTTASICSNIV